MALILKQKEDELETLEDVLRDKEIQITALEKTLGEKAPVLTDGMRNQVKKSLTYIAIQGDEVDELLAKYINEMELTLPVRRLEYGYYLFGTKKIYAKVMNGKLVVRVGGGYMTFKEFIETHANAELNKIAELQAKGNWDLEEYVRQVSAGLSAPEQQSIQPGPSK